jgi:hypothetical protein
MDTRTQAVPAYYVWKSAGAPVEVHLRLDVIDRLSAEVMRGYAAIPKRGAEVGGVLIGAIDPASPGVVRIDDFEAVPCDYRRGPSYQLTEDDTAAFEQVWRKWQPIEPGTAQAVGYFRSHTRDGLALAKEDVEILDHFFPGPANVALLVKPFATKAGVASFFIRVKGEFPAAAPLEFPFRSRDLVEIQAQLRSAAAEPEQLEFEPFKTPPPELAPSGTGPTFVAAPAEASRGTSWVWLLLSLLFLILGGALGYEAALTMGKRAGASPDGFSLALSVVQNGENLNVRWDRQSAAVLASQRGLLEIDDGGSIKPVELDPAQLRGGGLIYRNNTASVRFRLTVYPSARVSITETREWKR